MVGVVGEMVSVSTKRYKLWKTEGGWAVLLQQCYPNSARALVITRRTECNPYCYVVFFCFVGYPPNWGKQPRYKDR